MQRPALHGLSPLHASTRWQDLQGLGSGGKEQARRMRDFFTALALCHTVIPERFEDSDEVRAQTIQCEVLGQLLSGRQRIAITTLYGD